MDIAKRVNELMGHRPRDAYEDPEFTILKSYAEIREEVKALIKEAILEERAKWFLASNECLVSSHLIVGRMVDFIQKESLDYEELNTHYEELRPFVDKRIKLLEERRKSLSTDKSTSTGE